MSTAALSARTCAQLQQNLAGGGVKASGSPEPGMLLSSVTVDNVADRVSFDYQFTDAASPGLLQVFVDNQLVFVADQTVVGTILKNSGNVEIPRMQAGVHDFRVVVKALTSGDAGVDVRNIAFDRISSCPLSIAGDATATAAKDGLLLTRYLAGFRGDALVAGEPRGV